MSMSTKLYSATALALACQLLLSAAVSAQTAEPAGKAGSASGLSDSDRAKRDADKVLQWIKFHATHATKPEAPAPAPKPAPTAKAAAPAPKPAVTAAAAAPSQAAAPVPAPAASQESQVAAREPEPAPKAELVAAAPATPPAPPPTEPTRPAPQPQPEPEEEVALRLIQKVDPDIPRQLVSNIRNGSVMVRFQVKPDGSTTKVETLGNPNKRLASSAIAAVQQWKFAPIPKQREATVEIGFKLD